MSASNTPEPPSEPWWEGFGGTESPPPQKPKSKRQTRRTKRASPQPPAEPPDALELISPPPEDPKPAKKITRVSRHRATPSSPDPADALLPNDTPPPPPLLGGDLIVAYDEPPLPPPLPIPSKPTPVKKKLVRTRPEPEPTRSAVRPFAVIGSVAARVAGGTVGWIREHPLQMGLAIAAVAIFTVGAYVYYGSLQKNTEKQLATELDRAAQLIEEFDRGIRAKSTYQQCRSLLQKANTLATDVAVRTTLPWRKARAGYEAARASFRMEDLVSAGNQLDRAIDASDEPAYRFARGLVKYRAIEDAILSSQKPPEALVRACAADFEKSLGATDLQAAQQAWIHAALEFLNGQGEATLKRADTLLKTPGQGWELEFRRLFADILAQRHDLADALVQYQTIAEGSPTDYRAVAACAALARTLAHSFPGTPRAKEYETVASNAQAKLKELHPDYAARIDTGP